MIRSIVIVVVTCAATIAAADTRVSYFPVTPNAGAHDVAPAPDGSVYYTGQAKGYLGRLDPKTGKDENIPIGSGFGAAWRGRGIGRRGLDHRWWHQRQCAV
jgi:virginiamycin B lyase